MLNDGNIRPIESDPLHGFALGTAEGCCIVASNIANIDTPGYKTRDIDFASELQEVESVTQPRVIEATGLAIKNDGNNVSLDREMRLLSENALRFNIASALIKDDIAELRKAIQGG